MPKDYRIILKHILEAIIEIQEFSRDINTVATLVSDRKTLRAVERNLEIIGEASKQLPESLKTKYSSIPWRKISGIRDIIIHNYDGVDYEIVLDILLTKIDPLRKTVEQILNESGNFA